MPRAGEAHRTPTPAARGGWGNVRVRHVDINNKHATLVRRAHGTLQCPRQVLQTAAHRRRCDSARLGVLAALRQLLPDARDVHSTSRRHRDCPRISRDRRAHTITTTVLEQGQAWCSAGHHTSAREESGTQPGPGRDASARRSGSEKRALHHSTSTGLQHAVTLTLVACHRTVGTRSGCAASFKQTCSVRRE